MRSLKKSRTRSENDYNSRIGADNFRRKGDNRKMTEIILSVRPKWCELIASGRKTIEVRKTKPKCDVPLKVYIYCTRAKRSEKLYSNGTVIVKDTRKLLDPSVRYSGSKIFQRWNGKVIGEFVCDTIITDHTFGHDPLFNALSCMNDAEIASYCTANEMYGWHISDLIIYDKPKDLSDFGMKRAPQSWYYAYKNM